VADLIMGLAIGIPLGIVIGFMLRGELIHRKPKKQE